MQTFSHDYGGQSLSNIPKLFCTRLLFCELFGGQRACIRSGMQRVTITVLLWILVGAFRRRFMSLVKFVQPLLPLPIATPAVRAASTSLP